MHSTSSRPGQHILLRMLLLISAPAPVGCAAEPPFEPAEETRAIAAEERGYALESTTRIRVMAGNLTSGPHQGYDPGHGIRIFEGIAPDVVMIQEFNHGANTAADIRAFVDTAFGAAFSYYREGGAQIPNGIVSRWPIVQSGEWDDPSVANRDFAWARIDVPGPIDLWAVSVHLLTSSSSARNTEAQRLVSYIRAWVPEGDYLVIGGDVNSGNRSEPCIATLSQLVVTSGPHPADRNGNTNTNAGRSSPYDWVLADADLDQYRTGVAIGASAFANGLVADTRVYSPISEIAPALAADSGASYMQHMGVIRDFSIPTGTAPGAPSVLVNEILANEPGSDPAGELVEIVNVGTASAELTGWTLSDGVSTRHTFPAGTTLAPGTAIVVYGGASAVPVGADGAVAASTGALGLSNGGDTVTLRDGAGAAVDGFTYPSSLSGVDGVSMNRNPDASPGSPFVLHTAIVSSASSPGTRADGSPF
jgi:endonuclease/exonuclease/phosphatase family metal-dependent hydrolase